MTNISIAISGTDWKSLRDGLFTPDENENAGVLLCGSSRSDHEQKLLVRRVMLVPKELYTDRNEFHLEISPKFYNAVVSECLSGRFSPVIVHSHPTSTHARYSASDNFGESRLLPVLESLIPGATTASLLLALSDVAGRRIINNEFVNVDALRIVGQRSVIRDFGRNSKPLKSVQQFDRQMRAFGEEGQAIIERLRVAIVGVGGTGSLVAEQLARAGVRNFILIDPDVVETSNVNRMFGSAMADVGKPKCRVVGSALKRLGASTIVELRESAIHQSVLMKLKDCDLFFSCVDNDRSRAILSRFAHQYIVPMIDIGVRLDARGGQIRAAAGRVSIVGPGMACLRCSGHLNAERIRSESLPEPERKKLANEGYIMGIDEPAPAVVSLNTVVAGLGVTAALNLFVNLAGGNQPLDQLYDATSGTVFTVNVRHDVECDICDSGVGVKALGDTQIVSAY